MATYKDLSIDDIVADESFSNLEVASNAKASASQVNQIVGLWVDQAKQNAINYSNNTNKATISNSTGKRITAWVLLQLAENGTSEATVYPDIDIEFRVQEETTKAIKATQSTSASPAVEVSRDTKLSLNECVSLIRLRSTQRRWARFYADLTYRIAKTKSKTFAWGVANGVPSHFSYLGFDTADYITQSLLSIQERKCIRRTTAFAIANSGSQEITEDDDQITRVASKRESQQ